MLHLPSLLQSETSLFSQAWQLAPTVGTSLCMLPFHLEVHQLSIAPVILPALPQAPCLTPCSTQAHLFLGTWLEVIKAHVSVYVFMPTADK